MMSALSLRPIVVQAASILAAGLIAGVFGGAAIALSVGYGGAVAVVSAVLLGWRLQQGVRRPHSDAARHLRSFYRSALERFFVVGILLAGGFALTDLAPLPLLTGFVLGQVVWMVATLALRERT